MLNASQKGHWYECDNPNCNLLIPIPDKEFNKSDKVIAECKCGHKNIFVRQDAKGQTNKYEVDKYFGIKDPRLKCITYWNV